MSDTYNSTDRDKQLLRAAQIGTAAIFIVLAGSFWWFQVAQHARFSEMAEINHSLSVGLRPPRGVVFDRHGRVLIENRHSLNISLVRERVEHLHATIRLLAKVTQVDPATVRDLIGQNSDVPVHQPIVLIRDASLAQVAAVMARRVEMPGVVIEQIPIRLYPEGRLASHSFGYVGEISDDQLRTASDERMRAGAIVGQSGIEQQYNELLMGNRGVRNVVVDVVGREIETISEILPTEGWRIRLTLDADVQRAGEEAFRYYGYSGAAVALDPSTGDVLALVSLPGYDPNDFASGIDQSTWSSLSTDPLRPLQNRALAGRYPPGSTFKIVMAAAALEEGIITPNFRVTCRGGGRFNGRFFRCHSTHGTVALDVALEKSCNMYFYTLGSMLDIDVINRWAGALGLGVPSGIDLPHEVRGLVPSTAWKRERLAEPWYPGETISVSIGQGAVSVTPISLAVMMATVVNGGVRVVPRLLKAVRYGDRWEEVDPIEPSSTATMAPATQEAIKRGLWMVVNHEGTGGRARIEGRDVMGKSGTAQVVSLAGRAAADNPLVDFRDHGWFVFAAPRDDPQIAGVVFAEHSDHGYLAAPIAKHIMEVFFAKQDGTPPPVLPVPDLPSAPPSPAEVPGQSQTGFGVETEIN